MNIVHCDLKPANFVLKFGKYVKMIDFGHSGFQSQRLGPRGTWSYTAPEALAARRAGLKYFAADYSRDIWSLGIIIFEIYTNSSYLIDIGDGPPREGSRTLWYAERFSGITQERINQIIDERVRIPHIASLLKTMLVIDPTRRASIEDIAELPFFCVCKHWE